MADKGKIKKYLIAEKRKSNKEFDTAIQKLDDPTSYSILLKIELPIEEVGAMHSIEITKKGTFSLKEIVKEAEEEYRRVNKHYISGNYDAWLIFRNSKIFGNHKIYLDRSLYEKYIERSKD